MSEIPFDCIGFDLDGTLLDTHRDLGAAVNHALKLGGFQTVPVDSAKDLIGGAKTMLARAVDQQGGLPDDEFHQLYKQMLAFYAENSAVETVPYPGAIAAFDALEARGIPMAVVTNKFEGFARDILTSLGLISRFETVIGGDTLGKGRAKPAPDPILEAQARMGGGRMAYVGDTSYDVRAAKAAGVPVIAAAYGYCDMPPHELGADAVIDSLDQLIETLARL